jgi:transposase
MYDAGFRKATLNVYRSLRSLRKTSRLVNISKSTLQRWMDSHCRQRRTTCGKTNIAGCIQRNIERDPFLTCRDLVRVVALETGTHISRQLASAVLKRLGFSRVKARRSHFDIRSQQHQLDSFMASLQECIGSGKPIVAVDECGFDARLMPQMGYAPKGSRLRICDKRSRSWKRRHMVMAISTTGMWQHVVSDAPVNAASFAAFIENLQTPTGSVIVMDNIAFHKTNTVRQVMQNKGFEPLYIPPYCPDANPIENVFGILKQKFRKKWVGTLGTMTDVMNETIEETMKQTGSFEKVFRHCIVWLGKRTSSGSRILKGDCCQDKTVFCELSCQDGG